MTSFRGRVKARILDAPSIHRALNRMAHQILERNPNLDEMELIGIGERGNLLAQRLASIFRNLEGRTIPAGALESKRKYKTIVLVDAVIFTGRAAHHAIASILAQEPVECIQLAVLVDRGNREVPVHADYVGKSVPTAADEYVEVRLKELDNEEQVVIMEKH
ncbi:bifunctional pyr operon transcriptional regulator/uracil phosphoribosyltransferase [bacterium]|nr:bifunctional pyr operon transcriptional regulator/uracil phosphoribosyltransferase [bacterium]MCI0601484.1 bifunctional pyr operon transcriptional regulator/uracil phosphoribosyltransferase [bacterium]